MIVRLMLAGLLLLATVLTGAAPTGAADDPHGMYTPATIQWGDAPPVLPKGAKLAVLYGDPGKDSLYVVRLKLPANYKLPAHSHPTDEIVTVVSGSFLVGMGDKLDASKVKAFPAGSLLVAPAKVNHYAMTKQPAIVEVSGMGPFQLTYVNPADDPSKKQ